MNPSETYLHQLLAKTHWTDDECRWLLDYLEQTPGTELKDYMLERFRQQGVAAPEKELADSILAKIHARMQPPATPAPVIPVSRPWRKLALAAAVVAALAVAATLTWQRPRPAVEVAQQAPAIGHDVAPGGNKARLVLGNGQSVWLDQAADGPIKTGGGEQVHKEDAGLVYGPAGDARLNTLMTPNGGQYRVQLADGTKVWLNAASSLQYPATFTGSERSVTLTGEAYFEVAQDATRPFFVKMNGMTVQVLGTHFNINAYAEEKHFTTTLLEGAVRVVAGGQRMTLAPGQQSVLEQHSGLLQRAAGDAEDAVAWKNGLFTFKNAELAAVMRDIGRWYDVEVVYGAGMNEKTHVTGAMRRQEYLSQALKILELTTDLHFDVQGRTVTVSKK